ACAERQHRSDCHAQRATLRTGGEPRSHRSRAEYERPADNSHRPTECVVNPHVPATWQEKRRQEVPIEPSRLEDQAAGQKRGADRRDDDLCWSRPAPGTRHLPCSHHIQRTMRPTAETVLWTASDGIRCVLVPYDDTRFQLRLLRTHGTFKATLFATLAEALTCSDEWRLELIATNTRRADVYSRDSAATADREEESTLAAQC